MYHQVYKSSSVVSSACRQRVYVRRQLPDTKKDYHGERVYYNLQHIYWMFCSAWLFQHLKIVLKKLNVCSRFWDNSQVWLFHIEPWQKCVTFVPFHVPKVKPNKKWKYLKTNHYSSQELKWRDTTLVLKQAKNNIEKDEYGLCSTVFGTPCNYNSL